MKPGRIKKAVEITLVVVILGLVGDMILSPSIGRYYIVHRFTPHEKEATVQQLEKDFGVKFEIRRVTTKGRDYILATAPMVKWARPSGPPMYVFDSQGRLLDYTLDVGDDPRFRDKWDPLSKE